ncbi:hypothetical protein [Pyxidicoccus sp. MSG2]|uniref:hypothetical protein n=1 Tax=Pyxidicoccus sp. MSG2 TaxID=2996790 RepID=UPI00226E8FF6|nr:hypothetical protein [Pyxidicoccus sp. MSG2]MCY1023417.1 hypothetical protein [Pyxidicoccus sp. MSG2]
MAAPLLLAPPATASAEPLNQLAILKGAAASSVSVEHPILNEAIILAQQTPDGSDDLAQQYGQTYNQTYTESYTQAHTADETEEA